MKAFIHIITDKEVFIATLSVLAKTGNKQNVHPTEEQINKFHYIHTRDYYSAIKRNEFSQKLERISYCYIERYGWTQNIYAERSQTKKRVYIILFHLYNILWHTNETIVLQSGPRVSQGLEGGWRREKGMITKRHKETYRAVDTLIYLYYGDCFVGAHIYQNTYIFIVKL